MGIIILLIVGPGLLTAVLCRAGLNGALSFLVTLLASGGVFYRVLTNEIANSTNAYALVAWSALLLPWLAVTVVSSLVGHWAAIRSKTQQQAQTPPSPEPERDWQVTLRDGQIIVQKGADEIKSIDTKNLGGIIIETNDQGPWNSDVWWLLFDENKQLACAFPQGAEGEKEAVELLSSLPSFDHEAMIKAMGSTDNAVFPVWEKT